MSTGNTIIRSERDVELRPDEGGFQIPAELRKRYDVRIVHGNDEADRRIGLFLAGDRENPSIEISGNGDRIVARREDPETVGALVKIAKANGWEGIDVDGSPAFRKAIWAAGTREGLTVRGYEPSFDELAKMDALRREDAALREREAGAQASVAEQGPANPEAEVAARPAVSDRSGEGARGGEPDHNLSHADERLLLTLSAYAQDRKALEETVRDDMSPTEREFRSERLEANRAALDGALERVLESPTLISAFSNAGHEPDNLRRLARAGEWDGQIADAISAVRFGRDREEPEQNPPHATEAARYRVDRWDAAAKAHVVLGETNSPSRAVKLFKAMVDTRIVDLQEGRSVGDVEWVNDGSFPRWNLNRAMAELAAREESVAEASREEPRSAPTEPARTGETPTRLSESEELAELFLHGSADRISADPRLANAREAQATMERHLGEVFDGDARQTSVAALESRQLISDVLRRGLDVSVREPTPVRQIEPPHITPDLER